MRPSDEERREVAARLREARANLENIPRLRDVYQSSFIYLIELAKAVGDSEILNRLADLIEPEPERTCELERVKKGALYDVWRYTCCGYEHAERVSGESIAANFCPSCGAKVVEEL